MRLAAGRITAICSITWKWECFVKSGWRNDANEENLKAIPVLVAGLFTSQLSIVTNGAIVIHTQRLKSDPGGNLLS